jgi:large subunit ribosomal protein L9
MKIILLQEVANLGDEGQVVDVKNGYGRNYLIPNKLARLATPSAIRAWEEERRQSTRKLAQKKGDAENLAKEIESLELVVTAKVGEENRIFGSITSQDLAIAFATHGVSVERKNIQIDDDIRTLGVYTATVRVHPEVTCTVKVRVDPEHLAANS